MKKTVQPKHKDIDRKWHLVDARDRILGRLASEIAGILMGKHKALFSYHMDMGDNVVVVNASQVELTGKKKIKKVYRSHSGYPGGFKEVSFEKMMKEKPARVIEMAVSGMLPQNRLKQARLRRLKVFKDAKHTYDDKFKSGN